MKPKNKANDLIQKYNNSLLDESMDCYSVIHNNAKKCALIAVDEIIKEYGTYYKIPVNGKYLSYWEEVKRELKEF